MQMAVNGDSVVATSSGNSNTAYSYYIKAVKASLPLIIKDMGKICQNLNKFNWQESVCPFPAVTGTGGTDWSNQLQYIGAAGLAGFNYAKEFTFFFQDLGSVGDNPGARSKLVAFNIKYNDDTTIDTSPPGVNLYGMPAVTCGMAQLEYLVSLQILPVTTGAVNSRGVAGLKWKTNTGKICSVPSSIQDDPIWSSIDPILGPDLGNGVLYGAITGFTNDGYIGALGLITYEMYASTLTLPQWSVQVANNMFQGDPVQLASVTCPNIGGTVSVPCELMFQLSRANQNTFTNAYTSSTAEGKSRAVGATISTSYTLAIKFATGALINPITSAEMSNSFTVGASTTDTTTTTKTETWGNTDTTATAITDTVTTTCSYKPPVPPGHTMILSGIQKKGNFSIPWNGTFSYILKGGAHFTFDAAGEYSAQLESGCDFNYVLIPPLPPSPSPKPSPTPMPSPSKDLNKPPNGNTRSLLQRTCGISEICSRSGTEASNCECPPGTKCIPMRFGARVDKVCRAVLDDPSTS
jgi:hypothetical protein